MRFSATCFFLSLAIFLSDWSFGQEAKKEEKITYQDHIQPIFRQHCFSCHNQNKKEGDLDLTNYTNLMQGGGSGAVIEPGETGESYLFALVNHDDEPAMPPEQPKIPAEKIALLSKWIETGALENSSSKAKIKKKKKFDFALSNPAAGKPAVMPLPGKLDLQPVIHTKRATGVTAMATSPWAPLTAIAGQKQVLLLDSRTRELKGVLPFPDGVVSVLKFSRNGSLLLAGGGKGGASGKVVVWNLKNGKRIIEVGDELDTVLAADISSDQKLIALGGPQRLIRVYSTADNSLVYEIKKHTEWVTSLEFSPDGVLLATGDRNGGVHVWEAFSGREYLTLKAHTKSVTGISWRQDSNIVATTSEDGSIRLWEMNNGGQVRNWGAHGGGSLGVEFTRAGNLVSCGRDRYAKIWDQAGKQLFAFPAFGDIVMQVTHCDESNTCFAGDWSGEIRQFNAADGKQLALVNSNPLPLETRLATAKQSVGTADAAAKQANQVVTADKAALDKLMAEIAAATQSINSLTASSKTVTAKINADKANQATYVQQGVALKSRVDSLAAIVPSVKTAKDNAAAASAKLPADAELKKIATDIANVFAAREAELTQKSKQMADLTAKSTALTKAIQTNQTELTKMTAMLTAAKQKLATLQPQLKPAQDKYAAAQKSATDANGKLQAANALVQKWTDAIAFSKSLRELNAKIESENQQLVSLQINQAEVEEKAQVAQQNFNKMESAFKQTEAQMNARKAALETSKTKLAELQKKAATLNGEVNTLKSQTAQVMAAQPLIAEAKAKLDAAQKANPGDQDLINTQNAVNLLITKQNTRLAALAKSTSEKAALVAQNNTAIQAADVAMKAAQKAVDEYNVLLVSAQKQMTDAKTAMDAANTQVSQVVAKVAQKSTEIKNLEQQVSKLQEVDKGA